MWNRIRHFGRGWRTVAVNAAAGVSVGGSALIAALASDAQDVNAVLGQFITPARAAVFVSALTLVNVLLRFDTRGPVGNNPP